MPTHRPAKSHSDSVARAVVGAERRLAGKIRETPVEPAPILDGTAGRALLKLENQQVTGSFKVRGATNKLLCLTAETRARGVVAASSGNHGAGVAHAAAQLGCPAVVYVPDGTAPFRIDAIEQRGAEVRVHGDDCVDTERAARAFAAATDQSYVSPYNDADVIAGQGTIGAELDRQLDDFDAVYVAMGGGGMIAGIGSLLRARRPGVRVVACSPRNSAVMHASLAAGRILDMPCDATLSDATAGGIEAGSITFDLCREIVDDSVVVTEDDIRAALRLIIEHHHMLIEGAAAVAVAGYLARRADHPGETAVIVLCGANIEMAALRSVLPVS